MATADKDLETLRKEHKELSDHAGRIAIVSLTILTLLTISFSRAWNRVESDEVKTDLCRIKKAHEQYRTCWNSEDGYGDCDYTNVSYVFGMRQEQFDEVNPCKDTSAAVASPTPTPTPCPTPTSTPSSVPTPTPSPSPVPTPCSSASPEQRLKLKAEYCGTRKELEAALEKNAGTWFVVKMPVPGMDFTIDLRDWAFTLPVIFSFFGLYLYILRKKLALLENTAVDRWRQTKPEEVTQLDRLYFEGDRAYALLPFKLTAFLVKLALLVLPSYLIYIVCSVAWSYRDYGGTETILALTSVLVLCLFYAFAYAQFASLRLERQIEVPRTKTATTDRFVNRSKQALKWLATSIHPKLTLAIGAVLTLMTLMMPFTKDSFWSRRSYVGYREDSGYQLLVTGAKTQWPTVPDSWASTYALYGRFGIATYILGLLVASSAIAVLLPFWSRLIRKWIVRFSTAGAAVVVLFALTDFSFTMLYLVANLSFSAMIRIKEVMLLISLGVLLWAWYLMWRGGVRRTRGKEILVMLVAIYAPAVVISAMFVGWLNLEGLIAYLAGGFLLLVGFLHMRYRLSLADTG